MQKKFNIAIDGPAGAGKSTVARKVAEHYRFIYVDTGAMYRSLTWKALQQKLNVQDEKEMLHLLKSSKIQLFPGENEQVITIDDLDVTQEIREPQVSQYVSFVASHKQVRQEMVKLQREMASERGVVMDGRDIGTHVLPDAEVKVFLTASLAERAKRRYEEGIGKGLKDSYAQILKDMQSRDEMDQNRKHAPLKKAADATEIDTSGLSIAEVMQQIIDLAKLKIQNQSGSV